MVFLLFTYGPLVCKETNCVLIKGKGAKFWAASMAETRYNNGYTYTLHTNCCNYILTNRNLTFKNTSIYDSSLLRF